MLPRGRHLLRKVQGFRGRGNLGAAVRWQFSTGWGEKRTFPWIRAPQ